MRLPRLRRLQLTLTQGCRGLQAQRQPSRMNTRNHLGFPVSLAPQVVREHYLRDDIW